MLSARASPRFTAGEIGVKRVGWPERLRSIASKGGAALLLVAVACSGGAEPAPTLTPVADPLLEMAKRDGTVVVIVQLAVPQSTGGSWEKAAVAGAQRKLLAELGPRARVLERFGRRLPQIMLRVNPAGLQELRRSPVVVNITLNEADEPTE